MANMILAMLPANALQSLQSHLSEMNLVAGDSLAQPGDEIRKVYFPHSGIVSFLVELVDGGRVQTGLVGRDGVVGAPQALDGKVSLNQIVVQASGAASVIDRDPLRELIARGHPVGKLLQAHGQFFTADVQQTAACNATHTAEARVCRWMLRMSDLIGAHLPMTQEAFASIIGVRRTTVSLIASQLQAKGVITYSRGRIRVADHVILAQSGCECHAAGKDHYARLFKGHLAMVTV